ncbi:hypothetical protein [Streptomyces sp. NPDC088789]|uniref:Rv1733c family protein n=1 Tax=Streptomyces sp. NPDC088789 TaxID=3365899 RepID=UPI003813531B
MRAISGLWRWRHNPLCRASDLVECWAALVALSMMLVVAPVIGVLAGSAAQDTLDRSIREQRDSRLEVTATVVRRLGGGVVGADPEAGSADARSRVLAHWTAPDGDERREPVLTALSAPRPGDTFTIWTDRAGQKVARPLDPATAATHAALAGFGAALVTAGLVEVARRLVLWRLVRHRYARWDQAWDRAGPDWGRTGTGS